MDMAKRSNGLAKINPVIRWLMPLSLIIIFLTLLTSWLLWFFLYRETIEAMIVNFSFITFSIVILSLAGLALFFALPLLFQNKKGVTNSFFSLLSFILTLTIVATTLLFYRNLKIDNFLLIVLPWIITIVATAFLFLASGINLVIIKEDNKVTRAKELHKTVKEPLTNTFVNNNLTKQDNNLNLMTNVKQEVKESEISSFVTRKKEEIALTDFTSAKDKIVSQLNKSLNFTKTDKNTTTTNWTKNQIKEVWEKATIIPGVDKDLYRKDYAGAWMFFGGFVNLSEDTSVNFRSYSWTIMQNKPLSQKGTNDLENLSPMNVMNALTKGQSYPKWKTKISSRGNENIIKEQIWSD